MYLPGTACRTGEGWGERMAGGQVASGLSQRWGDGRGRSEQTGRRGAAVARATGGSAEDPKGQGPESGLAVSGGPMRAREGDGQG